MDAQKVLVVDDSPTDLHLLTEYLRKNGFTAVTAETGEEALNKAVSEHPDLILMDIVMPGMNGYQATRALGKNPETWNIPVMMISSKNQETDKIWGLRQGARDFIVKPVNERTLVSKIRAL